MKKLIIILLVSLGLQTQAQINYCDSISYTTASTMNYPFIAMGDAGPISNMIDSISWSWSVCNSSMCYSGYGDTASFGQVLTTDTLKVCYDVIIFFMGATYTCYDCDSLIYDGNSWVSLNMGNPTAIKEIQFSRVNNDKIYDLLGRELDRMPIGEMYIRNSRLYISK